MSAWVLPDHIADVLPVQARHIEQLRRRLLDCAERYGYELVIPPLLEYLESLLTGTGQALDLQTFKLVDQLCGRTMGLRADTTPQAARIDAHLLNRQGVARLCYCGPVLHTAPAKPHATREPMQFGAEIFGSARREADLEVIVLALQCLQHAGLADLTVDLADAQLVRSALAGAPMFAPQLAQVHAALAAKDVSSLRDLTRSLPSTQRETLLALTRLYGDESVLLEAEKSLPPSSLMHGALAHLKWLAEQIKQALPQVKLSFDLSDARGYAYYTGMRFAVHSPSANDALVRGGRYDEVGSVFGRNRPAAGFSMDVKDVAAATTQGPTPRAIRALWSEQAQWREAIARLRGAGETVVNVLPGHEAQAHELDCDRELVQVQGQWIVKSLHTGNTG